MLRTGTRGFAAITYQVGTGTAAVVFAMAHPIAHKDSITALVNHLSMNRPCRQEEGDNSMQSDENDAFPCRDSGVENREAREGVEVEEQDEPQAEHSEGGACFEALQKEQKEECKRG